MGKKPKLQSVAKAAAAAAVMWIYVQRMCELKPADYKQKWKTHWVLMHSNIRLHTWPRAQIVQWRCFKAGRPCRITPPATASLSLSRLSHPVCVPLISRLYHELKRPATNIALRWPGRRAGHLTKARSWPFYDVLLVACFVASNSLCGSTDVLRHRESFQVTGHDRLSLGSLRCSGLTLIPSLTSMWNWGHMARAYTSSAGGGSWQRIVARVQRRRGLNEAWQDQ